MDSKRKLQRKVARNKQRQQQRQRKAKKMTRARHQRRLALRGIAFLLLLAILIFGLANIQYLTPSRFPERLKEMTASSGKGRGYPYSFETKSLISMEQFGTNNTALLSGTSLTILNNSAKEVAVRQHAMANPVMQVTKDRILIYDQGARRLQVHNSATVLYENAFDYPIVCADLSNNGALAVVTQVTGMNREVKVYNRSFQNKFTWNATSGYVVDVALSQDGKSLAVALIDSTAGEAVSFVILFDVASGKQLDQKEFAGELVFNVTFQSSTKLAVLSDQNIRLLSRKGDLRKEISLPAVESQQLYVDSSGNIIHIYSLYNVGEYTVDVFGTDGEELIHRTCTETVVTTNSDGGRLLIVYESGLLELSAIKKESVTYQYYMDSLVSDAYGKGKIVYYAGSGQIAREKLKWIKEGNA